MAQKYTCVARPCKHSPYLEISGEVAWVNEAPNVAVSMHPDCAPASRARWFVARDGVRVSPLLKSSDAASKFIQDHQGMSVDWAIRWEGWRIEGPYELQPESTYGTDDVAKQEEIEAARVDAGFARSKARETRKAQ